MGEHEAAQAVVLIRALCDLREKMLGQLSWLEDVSRREAAALRRDIKQAEAHITRLQRQYLGAEPAQTRQPASHLRRVYQPDARRR
jgi:hypothetical protein